jgi:hypothetical protein
MSGKKYVPDGVWLTCSCGTCYSVFKIMFHKKTDIYGSNMATEGDRWPFLNIKPMGLCSSKLSLCVPSPVLWKDYKQGIMIGGNQMLLEDSTAMCMFGGTIQIHFTLEAAQAACPFGSLKRPSEYIKDGFDWVFENMNGALSDLRGGLANAGAPNWLLNGVDQLAWNAQFSVGIVEGAINAVVGLGEVVWDIASDPVGIGTAIVEGVADGATKARDWMMDGENWKNAAESSWDYVTSPDKWAETAKDAAAWVQDNPRTLGNVTGEIAETALEVALTAGAATAAKVGGKVTKEVVEEVVEKGAKEVAEEAAERAAREAAERAAREAAERAAREVAKDGVQKSLPKVITKDGIDEATQKVLKESAEKTGKNFDEVKKAFDPSTATNKQKGNFGEVASANNMQNNPALKNASNGNRYNLQRIGDDAPKGLDDAGHNGIDGIYKNATPPPQYVIDEAKYGSSRLSKTTKDGPQMSDNWVTGNKRLDQVGPEKAREIEKAMKNGDVEKVVSKIDEAGNVTTYKVDAKGNIGGPWP